jgi:hypothetical protein
VSTFHAPRGDNALVLGPLATASLDIIKKKVVAYGRSSQRVELLAFPLRKRISSNMSEEEKPVSGRLFFS